MILDPDYARIFTQARVVAWSYGYTCAAIGSYTRDLDLLLVPWEDRAIENHDQLLKLIAQSCGLRFRDGVEDILKAKPDWTEKPHGRRSCSLFFPGAYDRRWVDIGIVPCRPKAEPVAWMHTVAQHGGEGEQDKALSFMPDNFPLKGEEVGMFYSIGQPQPLFLRQTPDGGKPTDVHGNPDAYVRAIAAHIDGWRSATFGWQDDSDPAQAERNRQEAIKRHATECLRRIQAELFAAGGKEGQHG